MYLVRIADWLLVELPALGKYGFWDGREEFGLAPIRVYGRASGRWLVWAFAVADLELVGVLT